MQKEMVRKTIFFILILTLAIVSIWLFLRSDRTNFSTDVVTVVTSFYPLAEFAQAVGSDYAQVINITRAGVEPHDYEPSPRDIATSYTGDIFIFNGGGLDPWAEKIQSKLIQQGVLVINMTENLELMKMREGIEGTDPHIWLDPVFAQQEVMIIRDAFKKVDPQSSETYEANAAKYISRLSTLDQKFRSDLATCTSRDVVTSHDAFHYVAKRYDFNVIPIAGLSPEAEPSTKKIAEIANVAREKNIQYIFFETLVSPKLAETIASEIGAQTLVFNPIEGLTEEELAAGKNYLSVMEENLENLKKALQCQ